MALPPARLPAVPPTKAEALAMIDRAGLTKPRGPAKRSAPRPAWQHGLAKARQPYLPRLVVPPEATCSGCGHYRSSHSLLVLHASCKAAECRCAHFETRCGCRHVLSDHGWSTPPDPWACASCDCKHFGAISEAEA